ncbi:MAG: hypothetical protein HY791_29940 [Deltaproteobacteria bacterium]|nr:hypothetical protein [Deltaproteobacteria bacterium]
MTTDRLFRLPAVASSFCSFALLFSSISVARAETAESAGERTPMAFLIVSPQGTSSGASSAAVFEAARTELTRASRIELLSFEQLGIDAVAIGKCARETRVSCWVELARPDYDRLAMERPGGSIEPSIEARVLAAEGGPMRVARFLLVLTIAPLRAGEDRVAAIVVDTDSALEKLRTAPRSEGWRQAAERQVLELVRATEPEVIDVSDPSSLRSYFRKLVETQLRGYSPVEFTPLGQVRLSGTTTGDEILLDGKVVARALTARMELVDVVPGARVLSIPNRSFRARLVVEPGGITDVTLPAFELPVEAHPARGWVRGAALASFAAGIGLAIVSAAVAGSVRTGCVVSGDSDCHGLGQPGFGFSTERAPAVGAESVNPAGLTWLQASVFLLGLGAGAGAGLELLDDDTEFPWKALLMGVGVGALGATATLALNPR